MRREKNKIRVGVLRSSCEKGEEKFSERASGGGGVSNSLKERRKDGRWGQ